MTTVKHQGHLLLVDDDCNLVELLTMRLASANYEVKTAFSSDRALQIAGEDFLDLAIVDLRLGEEDGIALMQKLHADHPLLPVIILTAHGTIESAVEAIQKGAYTYLTKPFDSRDLLLQIEKAVENYHLNSEITRLRLLLKERYEFSNIIARSQKMQQLLEMVARIAGTDSTVYIHGESGSGKEVIAKAIHLASQRKDKAFVAINCAALPETLLESELFGHDRGAFTGAVRSTKGLFCESDGGTLFLDEIVDMPLTVQAKLLRVLQERQFYPVGGTKSVAVDVRVIVATKRDLAEEVNKGTFREDLFYRVHVIPINLPPLRERKEDIRSLVQYFLAKFSEQMKKNISGISPGAMRRLMDHDWPGNVRELEHSIEFAVAMAQEDMITEDFILPSKARDEKSAGVMPLKEAKQRFEKDYLLSLLDDCQGNVSKAARIAGKYRADFYELLKKYSIYPSDFKKKPASPSI
jgi:two-component system response regulator GlrR